MDQRQAMIMALMARAQAQGSHGMPTMGMPNNNMTAMQGMNPQATMPNPNIGMLAHSPNMMATPNNPMVTPQAIQNYYQMQNYTGQ